MQYAHKLYLTRRLVRWKIGRRSLHVIHSCCILLLYITYFTSHHNVCVYYLISMTVQTTVISLSLRCSTIIVRSFAYSCDEVNGFRPNFDESRLNLSLHTPYNHHRLDHPVFEQTSMDCLNYINVCAMRVGHNGPMSFINWSESYLDR